MDSPPDGQVMKIDIESGKVIAPPVPAFYNRPATLDDIMAAVRKLGVDEQTEKDVLAIGCGDCKDTAALACALLRSIGVKACRERESVL